MTSLTILKILQRGFHVATVTSVFVLQFFTAFPINKIESIAVRGFEYQVNRPSNIFACSICAPFRSVHFDITHLMNQSNCSIQLSFHVTRTDLISIE